MTELEQLVAEIATCQKCPLARGRTNTVPGDGPADAKLMFIGEAPGFHEDRQGRPFVGAAGQFLQELLASIKLAREQVFICNVIKCRPPDNRDPLPEEIEACRGYLDWQIALIKPRVIVTLGRHSMARYFPDAKISSIHGRAKKINGVLYVPMFHPAAALHQPQLRHEIEADFAKLPGLLQEMGTLDDDKPAPPKAQQLSLF
jgi:uracil-DNA glycosylase